MAIRVIYPIVAFVPVIAAPTVNVYVGSQSCEPIAVQSFQYEDTTAPILPPAPPSETITIDKWDQGQSIPRDRQRLARAANNTFVVVVTPPVTAVYVSAQATNPIAIQSFQYDERAEPLRIVSVAEAITVDKWQGVWPQPYFKPKRLIQYGVNCAVAEQADDGLPPVWWNKSSPVEIPRYDIKRYQRLYPTWWGVRLDVVPPPPTVTVDRWFRELERPRKAPRPTWSNPSVSDQLFNVPTPPAVSAVYVASQSNGPIWLQSFQYDDKAEPLRPLVTAETITVDKWWCVLEQPPKGIRRALQGWFTIDPTLTRERTTPDKWWRPLSEPVRANRRPEGILSRDVSHFGAVAETITVDKWFRETEKPRWSIRRATNLGWWVIDPTLRAERTSLDKWAQPISQPYPRVRRVQPWPGINVTMVIPSGDFLAPARNVGTISLSVSNSGTISLTVSNTGTPSVISNNQNSITITSQNVGTI